MATALVLALGAACGDTGAPLGDEPSIDAALIDAAWDDDVQRAAELIASGADVNHQDGTRQSAYLIATSEGYLELLELTLENGADVTSLDSFNGTGLIRAAERGHADVVGRLLQTDIDVDHVNNLGWTALHEAVILGSGDRSYVDTVRLLVAGGADVTILPADRTPLVEHARRREQSAVAAVLETALEAQPIANPDAALLAAAGFGDIDGAMLALAAGADLDGRDETDRTAHDLAAVAGHRQVVELLDALGAPRTAAGD